MSRSDVSYLCPEGRPGCAGSRTPGPPCTGCDAAGRSLTMRELEVLDSIAGGARSLGEIASSVEPPISWRTAEAHMISINAKLPTAFEPKLTPFLRVLVYVLVEYSSEKSE